MISIRKMSKAPFATLTLCFPQRKAHAASRFIWIKLSEVDLCLVS